jgi:hypothetical protein
MIEIQIQEVRGNPIIDVNFQPIGLRDSRLGQIVVKFLDELQATYSPNMAQEVAAPQIVAAPTPPPVAPAKEKEKYEPVIKSDPDAFRIPSVGITGKGALVKPAPPQEKQPEPETPKKKKYTPKSKKEALSPI